MSGVDYDLSRDRYRNEIRNFLRGNPTLQEFRDALLREDMSEEISGYTKGSIVFTVLLWKKYNPYLEVFFSLQLPLAVFLDTWENPILHWALDGRSDIFSFWLRYYPMEVCRPYIDTHIEAIVQSEYADIFDLLVSHGYLTEENLPKIMSYAIHNNSTDILDVILHEGQRIATKSFITAEHFVTATLNGRIDILQRLVVFGGDVNLADKTGVTPLLAAIFSNNPVVVEEVLSYGARAESVDKFNHHPLMMAITQERLHPLVESIIKAGANVNYRNEKGETPLSLARRMGNENIIRILLSYGAAG